MIEVNDIGVAIGVIGLPEVHKCPFQCQILSQGISGFCIGLVKIGLDLNSSIWAISFIDDGYVASWP
jgi:hypothetical protein